MLKEKNVFIVNVQSFGDILGMGPRKAPVKLSLYYFSVELFVRSYNATHTAEGGEIMVKHCAIVLFLIPDN